ncbi:MAG: hypothetical protein JNM78_15415 [Cyclobacteriaceae bacterium]|nr:hypothetical protein [Cyclobacteriaceae bacterium]
MKILDDFENINCDFSNRYEWTGGMDPKNSAELSSLTRLNKKRITGVINFDSYGSALVTFKKIGNEWKIDNLTLGAKEND